MEIICYSCGRGENPENSIEGIQHCLKVNPNWRIEMDLQITKDEHIILFHDNDTERTTGVKNVIHEMTLNSVKKLNPGYNFKVGSEFPYRQKPIEIPTLEEVCKLFPGAKFLLDIHTENRIAINKIIQIIERNRMEKQMVIVSQYDHILSEFKVLRPNWEYGAPTKEVKRMVYSSFLFLDHLFPIKSNILMLPVQFGNIKLLTTRVINHVKNRNIKLWVWLSEGTKVVTVNSKTELNALNDIGVNGVFTEFPAKLNDEMTLSNIVHKPQ